MRGVFGFRTVLQAAFLVAVPVVSLALGLGPAAVADVLPIGVSAEPRSWNLWDLERLRREHQGGDAIRDEERTFLLMNLSKFAGDDSLLPVDFDGLVRDSFGDLVGPR